MRLQNEYLYDGVCFDVLGRTKENKLRGRHYLFFPSQPQFPINQFPFSHFLVGCIICPSEFDQATTFNDNVELCASSFDRISCELSFKSLLCVCVCVIHLMSLFY